MEGYSPAQRRQLERAATGNAPIRCPACGAILTVNDVAPSRQVAYVRRRVWVICPSCHRSAAVDLRPESGSL